ncbi:class I SAM-dependent methyltransferase [Nonomuraea sp. NPDC050547]|uniref:class I SAM-dependent methyltransferase n=1 Tax=Nonomuraea sp. NPDC050547 TaxID=3364368 RepID=UPI0037890ED3
MANSGTGPGSITPDGSPVEFYLLIEPGGEPEIVSAALSPGASILEIGSGVGRLTHPLLALGHEVVAVDESADMLAHVRGARTVRARAQELRLEREFDAVLLASYLVNTADDDARSELLSACARHVRPGGSVLIQWTPAEQHDAWEVGRGRTTGNLTITLAALEPVRPGVVASTMRYTQDERVWTQSFWSRRLTDDDLRAELERAGLRMERFLTDDHSWVLAVRG